MQVVMPDAEKIVLLVRVALITLNDALQTGNFTVLTTFAPLPNNRGFGPPVVEAVPDSIHLVGNQLLVTLLSGFPFPLGNAQVRAVDPVTGNSTPFITGLTSAIDVLPDGDGGFFTLEYSADMLAGVRAVTFPTTVNIPTMVGPKVVPTGLVKVSGMASGEPNPSTVVSFLPVASTASTRHE
jgi:hypothetical protein